MTWRIIEGDCRSVLASLPAESVQCCVTSPPYYGLRDYGMDGQLGLEATPDEYVAGLVDAFRGVRRVLRADGTVWLNLGDSYAMRAQGASQTVGSHDDFTGRGSRPSPRRRMSGDLKNKDLIGIPWMIAFALRADGWYLRSDIIWSKPNPMPESVTDRPTKAHEYLFLFAKSPRYFYDLEAIREPISENWTPGGAPTMPERGTGFSPNGKHRQARRTYVEPKGANKRSVWTVATQPYPGAHFATFPPKLIEPCVVAGSSHRACSECGAPWERIVERTPMVVRPTPKREAWQAEDDHARTQVGGTMTEPPRSETVGWQPTCGHDNGDGTSIVLDPFTGAGTTGMVALHHGRSFIGVELNADYCEMARNRIRDDAPLLNTASEDA